VVGAGFDTIIPVFRKEI